MKRPLLVLTALLVLAGLVVLLSDSLLPDPPSRGDEEPERSNVAASVDEPEAETVAPDGPAEEPERPGRLEGRVEGDIGDERSPLPGARVRVFRRVSAGTFFGIDVAALDAPVAETVTDSEGASPSICRLGERGSCT